MDKLARNQGDFGRWWSFAPQLDENDLRDGILELLFKIQEASVYDDWDSVQDHVKLYQLGESYCTEEPRLSAYEFGRMAIDCMYASVASNRGDYADAVEKLEQVKATYEARMARYARLGMPPRRASEVRYRFLLYLADLKWMAPDEWRDSVLTPQEVIEHFYETADNIYSFLGANPGSHSKERDLRDGLTLTELVCCKMALRHLPDMVPAMLERFNQRTGDTLTLNPQVLEQEARAKPQHSACYWDFELAKLRLSKQAVLQEIYMCIELRSLAAHDVYSDFSTQCLLRGWRREALQIVREVQAKSQA